MNVIKAKEITQQQLIRSIASTAKNKNNSMRYGFILGAGASVNSNIPSGYNLAKKWYQEITEDLPKDVLKLWQEDIKFDETKIAEFYTKIFEKRFETNYQEGYQELQTYMDQARPSIGYSFLAQLLDETFNKFVITTNFDTMTEDALFEFKKSKPLVLGHELLSSYINAISPSRPTIIKVHRDFLFDPYNTDQKIKTLDEQWQESLRPILIQNSMIVLGYGGNDDSLMNYLEEITDRKPVYWCYRGDKNNLSSKIKSLLNKKDFIVQINSFDEFMLLLSDKLDIESLIDTENIKNSQIVKNAIHYAQRYKEQIEKFTQSLSGEDEDGQHAIKKLLPHWWSYQLKVQNEINDENKHKIYLEGIEAYPLSYELMVNYANFLLKLNADKYSDKAEEYYKKALEVDPNHANVLGGYAFFLTDNRKDYDKAEEYYKKALEVDPNHANNLGNYALFLTDNRKDYDKAEECYKKALEVDPNHVNNIGNYAVFLANNRKDYDKAEEYYKKALEVDPNQANILGKYAFFLTNYRKDYDKAEEHYKAALEVDPRKVNILGGYALFLTNSRKDYDKAEEYYKKALEVDPNDANTLGNYALFLTNNRKDSDKAEEYYKKALEVDPNSANANGNYAGFLLGRGRKREAESYIRLAFKYYPGIDDLALELYFYKLAHFPEEYHESKKELDKLLEKGHKSIGWNFSSNIEQAKKDGFKNIEMLEEYAEKITKQ